MTNLNGLYIIDFHPDAVYADEKCINEYNRLKKANNLPLLPKGNVKPPIASIFPKKIKVVTVQVNENGEPTVIYTL